MVKPIVDSTRAQFGVSPDARTAVIEMIDRARRELGYREGSNNDNKFSDLVGHADNQFWCATFATWLIKNAGPKAIQLAGSASCAELANQFAREGRYARTPQPGDAIFFKFEGTPPNAHGRGHVGIVESVDPKTGRITTIEGNASDSVARRSYSPNDPSIRGFGRTFGAVLPGDVAGGPGGPVTPGSSGGSTGSVSSGGGGGSSTAPTRHTPGYHDAPAAPTSLSSPSASVSAMLLDDLLKWVEENLWARVRERIAQIDADSAFERFMEKKGLTPEDATDAHRKEFLAEQVRTEAMKLGDAPSSLEAAGEKVAVATGAPPLSGGGSEGGDAVSSAA